MEGMCSRTDCRAACGGGGWRNFARRGWTDSRAEKSAAAGSRILPRRTPKDLSEKEMALRRCYSDGGGAQGGCMCSRGGSEDTSGKVKSMGMWKAGEMTLPQLRELLVLLQKQS